ncbi:kanadaptin [Nilaparvata lugens]|uniref:kanadaptin n=1 Tax=Nilaparvata lugens TaxID=108931 RepID=UPI00193CC9EA|nr:kanadaptin [Nilaparvata lugens]XP_039281126.1 kanadaptin [Nilaparvata lugens]
MSMKSDEESASAEQIKNESSNGDDVTKKIFKVPVVFGPRKKTKIEPIYDGLSVQPSESSERSQPDQNEESNVEMEIVDYDEEEPQDYFGYKIPKWSRMPPAHRFSIEEMKEGVCVLNKSVRKEFYLFGRKENCHVVALHQSISRYHAIIQYGNPVADDNNQAGFYLFDMDTTHGSFINNQRIQASTFVKLNVDTDKFHFGFSTRRYAIRSVMSKLLEDRRKKIEGEIENKAEDEKHTETWADWGMGDDADEETDLSHNPYASELNEELYLADPKKTLRGWFEREGKELNYDVEQKRPGEYCCRIAIPVDDLGETLRAEVTVKGKKKECVVQAALEACRILDKHGLLRQSFHSKKKKVKNWAENDYYDSDDDSFFDRTGDIEKKRIKRMEAHTKIEKKVYTYESLLKDKEENAKKLEQSSLHFEKCKMRHEKALKEFEGGKRMKDCEEDDEVMQALAREIEYQAACAALSDAEKAVLDVKVTDDSLSGLLHLAKPIDWTPSQPSVEKLLVSDSKCEKQQASDSAPITSEDLHANEPSKKKSKLVMKKDYQSKLKKEKVTTNQLKHCNEPRKVVEKMPNNDFKRYDSEENDSSTEWTPPVGQTGDGRTHLNDKFGY